MARRFKPSRRQERRGIYRNQNALSSESAEITLHGPGNHLGSDGIDRQALDFLAPLADFIDDQDALTRFKVVLHLLKKPPFREGEQPWQDMTVLVRLRNELVHYKSRWGKEMEGQKLYKTLRHLGLAKPPFVPLNANYFPHQFLSAASAAWSVRTAVSFLNGFYDRLGIESRLKPYMSQFEGLQEILPR